MGSRKSIASRNSFISDRTSNYNSANIHPVARCIWDNKLEVAKIAHGGGMRPRIKLPPGELLNVLKKAGIAINIH